MVAVVGSILAYLATGLREKISQNERFEKQQNILYAMGINNNQGDGDVVFVDTKIVETEFNKYIKEQLVIVDGKPLPMEDAYLLDVKKQYAAAKEGKGAKLPLFIGEKNGKKSYIVPLYGKGLWDAIWGYMAFDETMTVQGVYFDHKAETPGLGANIKMRFFMDDFIGESILDGNNYAGISVAKGNNDPVNEVKTDNEVDAIAGATITGNGVSAMIKESLKLYKPYLQTIRTN